MRETPALFRAGSELYALPALVGCLAFGTAAALDVDSPALAAGTAAAVCVVRLLAVLRHWRGPRALRRRSPVGPSRVAGPTPP